MHSHFLDFRRGVLGGYRGPCVSLYQPTHLHYPQNRQDPIRFRNLLKTVDRSLRQEYRAADARVLLAPLESLAADTAFWNHTGHGLAVLAAPDVFRAYRLRRPVPERAVVAGSFHLKPLLRIAQSADAYHVLALNRQGIRLFEGTRDALVEVELLPGVRTLTEALGEERTEPHLTVASYGSAGGGFARRHGHGSRKDEIDIDTERFFRAVDRWIREHYSEPSGLPLILAALPEYHTPFRRVSQNAALTAEGVQIDPSSLDIDELRRRAWRVLEPQYLDRLARLLELFGSAEAGGRGSRDLHAMALAAVKGRVATLLVDADRLVPGSIAGDSGRLEFGDLAHPDVDDALDDLAELVLKRGGDVVVVPGARMPIDTGAAAIYRF